MAPCCTDVYGRVSPTDGRNQISLFFPSVYASVSCSFVLNTSHVCIFKSSLEKKKKVDTEKLISLVYEQKALWDVQCKNYHNRDVARKLWLEIAEELKSTSK